MMNITLLAAQAALADTLAGGNPVLTPVSEEARMNLWVFAFLFGAFQTGQVAGRNCVFCNNAFRLRCCIFCSGCIVAFRCCNS